MRVGQKSAGLLEFDFAVPLRTAGEGVLDEISAVESTNHCVLLDNLEWTERPGLCPILILFLFCEFPFLYIVYNGGERKAFLVSDVI